MRLIDADRLIAEFEDTIGSSITRTRLKLQVENQPTIDAVEIVRCKDCEHDKYCCRIIRSSGRLESDFCSYGERRTDETD